MTKQKIKKLSIRKQMKQQIIEQISTFSRVECEYVREIWCCYRIWSNVCNVCTYIFQFVSLLCEFFFFALSIFSFFVWFCFSFSFRVFASDNFFVFFLFEWIKNIFDLFDSVDVVRTKIENFALLIDSWKCHSQKCKCKKKLIKKNERRFENEKCEIRKKNTNRHSDWMINKFRVKIRINIREFVK